MTVERQVYEHVEEMTEDRQRYEHNKMFKERCGIKRETITVISLLFITLVIHCHRLALRICFFSTRTVRNISGADIYQQKNWRWQNKQTYKNHAVASKFL